MIHLRSFEHNGKRYDLMHLTEDDSRVVVEMGSNKKLLGFDCSLRITNEIGTPIARLTSSIDNRWLLARDSEKFTEHTDLGVAVRDFHWTNIELAEVSAAKILL